MCRQSSKVFEAFFALYSFNINSSPARAISSWLASSDFNTSINLQSCAFNSLIGAHVPMLYIAETVSETVSHPVMACATSRWADTETPTLYIASRWNCKCRFGNDFSMRITSESLSFPTTEGGGPRGTEGGEHRGTEGGRPRGVEGGRSRGTEIGRPNETERCRPRKEAGQRELKEVGPGELK